jgi:hypothetical protein
MLLRLTTPILASISSYMSASYFSLAIFKASPDLTTTLSTIAQIGATMMGFMLTALAILASISDKPLLKNMRTQGHYDDILNQLTIAAVLYFFIFIVPLIVISIGDIEIGWRYILLALLVCAVIVTLQIVFKLWVVLRNVE